MGFAPKRKIYNLKFEGAEYDGLVIKANSVTTGRFLDMSKRARESAGEEGMGSGTRELLEDFIGEVVEWNLEKEEADGSRTPWPIGIDALLAQDFRFTMSLHRAWMAAIGGTDDPLGDGSTGGEKTMEASMPMDVPSPNPPNSPEPTP